MIDQLFKKPKLYECAIINLENSSSRGSHWVAYRKFGDVIIYYDPLGNLRPPRPLQEYFGNCKVFYNRQSYQKISEFTCGQNCVKFLTRKLPCPLQ